MDIFHPTHMHKHDPRSNAILGIINMCAVAVEDKSKILGVLRDPYITRLTLLRPDDARPRSAAKECDEVLRDTKHMSG
jgi:hypothetical protein